MSSNVDDRLKPNDAALWQAGKGDNCSNRVGSGSNYALDD